jgi:sRNA-binding regulator protein Hfq
MKEMESTAVRRAPESEEFGNRKLIRPSLARPEGNGTPPPDRRERAPRKAAPAEQTHAENFYYQKQMQSKTPMVIVLKDGEEVHGTIEWYDKTCIKLTRAGDSNLLIYKPSIKYMYKEGESVARK